MCREAIDYWSDAIEKFLPERDRLADNRICDIKYDEIRCDPISAVRRIYEYFGWSLSREAEQRMRSLVSSKVERQSANHRYDLSQFGFSAARSAPCLRTVLPAVRFFASRSCAAEARSSIDCVIQSSSNTSGMSFEVCRVIRADHPSLPGHFPGAPLVPGVVILDEVLEALIEWRQNFQAHRHTNSEVSCASETGTSIHDLSVGGRSTPR